MRDGCLKGEISHRSGFLLQVWLEGLEARYVQMALRCRGAHLGLASSAAQGVGRGVSVSLGEQHSALCPVSPCHVCPGLQHIFCFLHKHRGTSGGVSPKLLWNSSVLMSRIGKIIYSRVRKGV